MSWKAGLIGPLRPVITPPRLRPRSVSGADAPAMSADDNSKDMNEKAPGTLSSDEVKRRLAKLDQMLVEIHSHLLKS